MVELSIVGSDSIVKKGPNVVVARLTGRTKIGMVKNE